MSVPAHPKVYHIVHVDRLASILRDGGLYCDAYVSRNALPGTTIGMSGIKARRLSHPLTSYPDLHVGDCVPFYFCPRSVMLYLISRGNHPDLTYRGGQQPIVHLAANLRDVVDWAEARNKRWVFTTTNAGSAFFDDYNTWDQLSEIDWDAVHATKWSGEDVPPRVKEGKQAEFLLEEFCPWEVFKCIFVYSESYYRQVEALLTSIPHKPKIQVQPRFYY
ncbi:MAG TPA: DUF4433 domain-containing protein [Candidatus Desulfovibrio intestinigallinarum]|nr:DUF4433 domain-containing protein [Candidatus Desulfovibrio intestinigallinarum]